LRVQDLAPLAIVFVILTIVISMGSMILTELDANVTDSAEANATIDDGITALGDFSGWFPILVVVIISAVIIGIVMRYFGGMGQNL